MRKRRENKAFRAAERIKTKVRMRRLRALSRDAQGKASSPLGAALDPLTVQR
jgi:hypothetical protein